ncbi:MAG: hypothetical protein AAGG50_00880 [Bacteroidota bacterium]
MRSDTSAFSNSYAGEDVLPLRAAPTVSRTQWVAFALRKLGEGFALVQDPSGTRFTFYQPGLPTQTCPPHAAKKLLRMGLLTVARTNARGTHYVVTAAATSAPLDA